MTYEELLKNHAGEMIERLVTEVITKDTFEVLFDFEDNEQWSSISMHIYEEDKEIALHVHGADRYELHFGYYDEEDEFFELTHLLTQEQKDLIPNKLQKIMEKVVLDEQGMRLPGNFLSK